MSASFKWGLSLVVALIFPAGTFGQEYPNRPVRLLVGYAPGGGMDTIARTVSPKLSGALNQQFIVENRAGASGGVAAEALVNAAPDGHVLMVAESGTLALPAVNPNVRLDPLKHFAPIGGIASLPMAFVVNPAFPAKNAQELIAELKAKPRKYTYASPGVGSLQHLAFELFKRSAGVDAIHVPYKGATTMMPDIMNGQVPIGVISVLAAQGPSKAGRIRTLAVTAPQRVPGMPDWPALAETLPGFSASPNVFLVAPAGTPAPVVEKLSTTLQAALASKEVEEAFAKQGAVLTPSSAPELGQRIADEVKRWAAVVKEAGIKVE